MEWKQLRVTVKTSDINSVSAVMSMIDSSLMIEDYSDIEENLMSVYGELIDESILKGDRSHARISVFLPEDKNVPDAVAFLRERFSDLKTEAKIEVVGVDEQDWANEWKKYFKPIRIGRHIVVTPPWEEAHEEKDDIVIIMDPGMAFGTGTHETTRLCMSFLEKYLSCGARVLDVGTGSGILAIAASKLGASEVFAYDLDPTAVKVASENTIVNSTLNVTCGVSDLLRDVDLSGGQFDFVCANIVADIILRMAPDISGFMKRGAKIAASGIIESRGNDVHSAMQSFGFHCIDKASENDWLAFVFEKV